MIDQLAKHILSTLKAGGELTLYRVPGSPKYYYELNLSAQSFDPVVVGETQVKDLLAAGLIVVQTEKPRWVSYVITDAGLAAI